jgi:hypothetical protein
MSKSSHLPMRFPDGTKYVLEGCGLFVRRYVEFPNGRRILLSARKAVSCHCADRQNISIVPVDSPDVHDTPMPDQRIFEPA